MIALSSGYGRIALSCSAYELVLDSLECNGEPDDFGRALGLGHDKISNCLVISALRIDCGEFVRQRSEEEWEWDTHAAHIRRCDVTARMKWPRKREGTEKEEKKKKRGRSRRETEGNG